MVHGNFPDVNPEIFLWRDPQELIHVSKTCIRRERTLCGLDTDDLTYAGRIDTPTCLVCVTTK